MNVVDSSAWLEFFTNGPHAAFFAPPILATGDLVVPVISVYEVFKKVLAEQGEGPALQAAAQMKQGRMVAVDETVALHAARLSLRHKLPMADALIFATANLHHATLWTQDEHFQNLASVRYLAKSALG